MSLVSSEGFDICTTESAMDIGVVVANLTDTSSFAAVMGDLAVDFVVSP